MKVEIDKNDNTLNGLYNLTKIDTGEKYSEGDELFWKDIISLKLIFDNSGFGIGIFSEEGRCLYANSELFRMLGHTRNQLRCVDTVLNIGINKKNGFESEFQRLKKGELSSFQDEKYVKTENGKKIWLKSTTSIAWLKSGQAAYLSMFVDISLHKQTIENLKNQKHEYRSLIDNSPHIVIRFDKEGNRLFVNKQFEKITGCPFEEAIGQGVEELYCQEAQPELIGLGKQVKQAVMKVLTKKQPIQTELLFYRRGMKYHFDASVVPEWDVEGKFNGALLFSRDITSLKNTMEMLSESKLRYKEIFEHSPGGIAVLAFTNNGRFVFKNTNHRFRKLVIKDKESLNGKDLYEIFPVKMANTLVRNLEDCVNTRKTIELDDEINFSVDTHYYYHYYLIPLPQKKNYRGRVIIIINDLTEIKQANEMQEMLLFALDHSRNPIYIVSHNSQIKFTNKEACVSTGYTRDEFLKMNITDLDTRLADEGIQQFNASLWSQKHPVVIETEHTRKDGTKYPVEVTISPFSFKEEDMSLCLVRDLSTSREVENLLMQSEQDFMTFVERSPDIIIRFDKKLKCRYNNEALEKITGYSQYDLIGKRLSEFSNISAELVNGIEEILQDVMQEGQPLTHDFELSHAISQLPVYLLCNFVPEYNLSGHIIGVLVVANDITTIKINEIELKKQKDLAEESNRLKSSFLATISHEVRTPANAIIGFADLLNDDSLSNSDRNEFIKTISKAVEKLIRVIDRILELSKIRAGNIIIAPEHFDLRKLLSLQYDTLSELCRNSGKNYIKIKIDLAKLPENMILFDDARLISQVLLILGENAIKFTEDGEISIGVKEINRDFVTLYISDTGIGIPEKEMEIIFDPFVQVDDKLTRKYEGIGIGLSTARKIIQALNSEINVTSEPGKGSTFFFTLQINQKTTNKYIPPKT